MKILKQNLKQKAVKLKVDTKKKPVQKDGIREFIKLISGRKHKVKPCDRYLQSGVEIGI